MKSAGPWNIWNGIKMMKGYEDLINRFVSDSREILSDRLTGIYLHGSMAMGCFNPDKSDIDLIIVIDGDMRWRETQVSYYAHGSERTGP